VGRKGHIRKGYVRGVYRDKFAGVRGLKRSFLRMTTKKVVGKFTENVWPHWLPFKVGTHSDLRRHYT